MTEKVGLIKNPLTIIAIFAGIAEVSGTIVLPFVSEQHQSLFIYFLILFPSFLVLLFFITLNFNNKVLYAPSDYRDETNYIKINKYDVTNQNTIEVKVPIEDLERQKILQVTDNQYLSDSKLKLRDVDINQNNTSPLDRDDLYVETATLQLLVTDFENATEFVKLMRTYEIDFKIYSSPLKKETAEFFDHRAIWLGKKVPLKAAQFIIRESKKFYPHLKYIRLSEHDFDSMQIYIGGSTKSAVEKFQRIPLKNEDFFKLESFSELNSFHKFIGGFGTEPTILIDR